MFQNFFAFLRTMATTEARAVRYGIIFMAISTTLVSALQLVLDGGDVILVLCIVVIALNAWWIFSPRRIAAVFGVGEIAELIRLFPRRDGFPPNEPGEIYWRTIKNVFYFLVAYLLLLPFIPLVNWWPSIIFLPAMLILIGVFFGSSGTAGIRIVGRLAVLCISFFALCNIFPQIGYYTGMYKLTGTILTDRAASFANQTDRLRAHQRAKMIEDAQQEILKWQKKKENAGKELPTGHALLLTLEAAQQGLTLKEFKDKLKAEADAKAKVEADARKAADDLARKQQAETLRLQKEAEKKIQQSPTQPIIREVIKANIPEPGGVETKRLQPGKYRLEPTDTIIRFKSEAQRRASGGWLVLNQNELVFFSLPPEKWETTKGEVKIIPQ